MAANQSQAFEAVVVEEMIEFTLLDLCRACGAQPSVVLDLVHEGVLEPTGSGPADWRFSGPAMRAARTAMRLEQALELGPSGAALVMDLLQEIESLRGRLRRAGLR